MPRAAEETVKTLWEEAALCRASWLCRSGRHAEAERLLAALPSGAKDGADALDLLARICAQQGRLQEAERHWRQCVQQDPSHVGSRNGLARLAKRQRRIPGWSRGLVVAGVLVTGFAAGAVMRRDRAEPIPGLRTAGTPAVSAAAGTEVLTDGVAVLTDEVRRAGRASEAGAAAIRKLQADLTVLCNESAISIGSLTAAVARLQTDLLSSGERAQPTLPPTLPPSPLSPPSFELGLPGVNARPEGPDLVVTFEDGLFDAGLSLARGAPERLRAIARVLGQDPDGFELRIVGFAAPDERLRGRTGDDYVTFGRKRAAMVAEIVGEATGWPSARILVGSLGIVGAPYPNDTEVNRARNRTVVLRIRNEAR